MSQNTKSTTGDPAANGRSRELGNGSSADLKPSEDLLDYVHAYARAEPQKAALWCLGAGFLLGWKLKPW